MTGHELVLGALWAQLGPSLSSWGASVASMYGCAHRTEKSVRASCVSNWLMFTPRRLKALCVGAVRAHFIACAVPGEHRITRDKCGLHTRVSGVCS